MLTSFHLCINRSAPSPRQLSPIADQITKRPGPVVVRRHPHPKEKTLIVTPKHCLLQIHGFKVRPSGRPNASHSIIQIYNTANREGGTRPLRHCDSSVCRASPRPKRKNNLNLMTKIRTRKFASLQWYIQSLFHKFSLAVDDVNAPRKRTQTLSVAHIHAHALQVVNTHDIFAVYGYAVHTRAVLVKH